MRNSLGEPTIAEPTIAIVGRQNVGKSTLYNRLLKRRIAITSAVPGVTRDALYRQWHHQGIAYKVCDTGGQIADSNEMDGKITAIAERASATATIILFVLDINQLTAEDFAVRASLMPYRHRVVCALNKADTARHELLIGDFLTLGFEDTIAISAAHNRNIDLLTNAIDKKCGRLQKAAEACIEGEGAHGHDSARHRIAIIGKPNVGKSTLIDALVEEDVSLVDMAPGTTRDVVPGVFSFVHEGALHSVEIVDTAGMRRQSKVKESVEFYALTRTKEAIGAATIVLLLIDAQSGITNEDKKIANHASEYGKGIIFVYNKIDLEAQSARASAELAARILSTHSMSGFCRSSETSGTGIRSTY